MKHLSYRADIDGLRAVAILAVLGFHAFPQVVPGGYIGVDVFFVISGFLISSIILKNHAQDRFSLAEFYSRRVRRIFPALLLVIAATWLAGWLLLLPDEFERLGMHIAGGIGFVANLMPWNESGYFDVEAAAKPLLHLWSLGVEEQYYLFWPLAVGLLYRSRLKFITIVSVVALLSFGANLITLYFGASASAFYLPQNRFWELMIGGVLAYAVMHHGVTESERWLPANIRSAIGCLLIGLGIVLIDADSSFPGWWALLPTVGSFLIISAPGAVINRLVLGNRVMVYIGLISYPLYLWHWPLLSFAHILELDSIGVRLGAMAAALLLAVLSYELLEKRIRHSSWHHTVPLLAAIAIGLLILGLSTATGKPPPRNNSSGMALAAAAAGDWEYPGALTPFKANGVDVFMQPGAAETVLFFGDSHVEQYAPRVVALIEQDPANTRTAVFATRGGCPPVPNVFEDHHPECSREFRQAIIDYALSDEVDSVVIGSFYSYLSFRKKPAAGGYRYYYLQDGEKIFYDQGGADHALQALERMIARIARLKTVYLLIDTPSGNSYDPKTFFSGTRLQGIVDKRVQMQPYADSQQAIREKLLAIAERTGAVVIDPTDYLCRDGRCAAILDDGTPLYKDSGHLRPFYMRQYVDYIDVTVRREAAATTAP